jgi:hypothetical protein
MIIIITKAHGWKIRGKQAFPELPVEHFKTHW